MNVKILAVILLLALASLACGFSINLPNLPTPGPEVTEQLSVPVPGAGTTHLQIDFSAGELNLSPGAGAELARGLATQALLVLFAYFASRFAWQRGIRRYAAVGG